MRTIDAIRHFGSQAAVARALGISQPSVAVWSASPPPLRQLQLEKITKGKLRADRKIMTFRRAA